MTFFVKSPPMKFVSLVLALVLAATLGPGSSHSGLNNVRPPIR